MNTDWKEDDFEDTLPPHRAIGASTQLHVHLLPAGLMVQTSQHFDVPVFLV